MPATCTNARRCDSGIAWRSMYQDYFQVEWPKIACEVFTDSPTLRIDVALWCWNRPSLSGMKRPFTVQLPITRRLGTSANPS